MSIDRTTSISCTACTVLSCLIRHNIAAEWINPRKKITRVRRPNWPIGLEIYCEFKDRLQCNASPDLHTFPRSKMRQRSSTQVCRGSKNWNSTSCRGTGKSGHSFHYQLMQHVELKDLGCLLIILDYYNQVFALLKWAMPMLLNMKLPFHRLSRWVHIAISQVGVCLLCSVSADQRSGPYPDCSLCHSAHVGGYRAPVYV